MRYLRPIIIPIVFILIYLILYILMWVLFVTGFNLIAFLVNPAIMILLLFISIFIFPRFNTKYKAIGYIIPITLFIISTLVYVLFFFAEDITGFYFTDFFIIFSVFLLPLICMGYYAFYLIRNIIDYPTN